MLVVTAVLAVAPLWLSPGVLRQMAEFLFVFAMAQSWNLGRLRRPDVERPSRLRRPRRLQSRYAANPERFGALGPLVEPDDGGADQAPIFGRASAITLIDL